MKTGLRTVRSLFACGGMLLLAACSPPPAPETLIFGDIRQPSLALVYVAEAQGYFRDEALNLDYRPFQSGRAALDALHAGTVEVAPPYELPVAADALAGKDFRILATLHRSFENAALVGRRDRGIAVAADLAGKRIGLAPNTNTDFMLTTLLKDNGVAENRVARVPLSPAEMAPALAAGTVDAVATWQPHVSKAQAALPAGATVVLRTPAYTELSMLTVRTETLTKKPEAVRRLLRALLRAEAFIANQNAAARDIVTARLADQSATVQLTWVAFHYQLRLDNLLQTALSREADWLAAQRTPQPPAPNFSHYLYSGPLAALSPQAVTLNSHP